MMNILPVNLIKEYDLCKIQRTSVLVHNRRSMAMYFVFSDGKPEMFIKLGKTKAANIMIENEYKNLIRLDGVVHNEVSLEKSIPVVKIKDTFNGNTFMATNYLSGCKISYSKFRFDHYRKAVDWIAALNTKTVGETIVTENTVERYVNHCSNSGCLSNTLPLRFQKIVQEIVDNFNQHGNATVVTCFSHNDFTSANLLFRKKRLHVIDWGNAMQDGFPFLDAFDLIFYLVNKKKNNYFKTLHLLMTGDCPEKRLLSYTLRKYSPVFGESNKMFSFLLKIFFIGKAYRFHLANRNERVSQLLMCYQFIKKQTDCHLLFG